MGSVPPTRYGVAVSSLLALKLFLSPVLVGGASWIQQRWGHAIGGRIIGLPLTTGPFLLIVYLQEGSSYAGRAAHGIVAGQLALAVFTYVYAVSVTRLSWWGSLGIATLCELGTTLALTQNTPSLALLVPINLGVIVMALRHWPEPLALAARVTHPAWELPARLMTAVTLIVGLSALAQLLGPTMAGALATYPVIVSVLGAFTQRRYGAEGVQAILRGLLESLPVTVLIIASVAFLLGA